MVLEYWHQEGAWSHSELITRLTKILPNNMFPQPAAGIMVRLGLMVLCIIQGQKGVILDIKFNSQQIMTYWLKYKVVKQFMK